MAFDKTNTIIIFKNTKLTNPKAPQWKGTVNVNGFEYDVPLWEREDKNGNIFLSGKVEPKREVTESEPPF